MRNRAYIYDRGALSSGLVGEITDVSKVKWGRVRDNISEAEVTAKSTRCSRIIEPANVGRYEMVVERDGKREWEGPITYLNFEGGFARIQAKDIAHYLNRTALTREWDNSKLSVFGIDRIRSIIEWECARKEALGYRILEGLTTIANPNGARTMRSTLPYEKYVFEEMDGMAWRAGIDYTVIRRNLLLNDTDEDLGHMRTLTQADFGSDLAQTTYGLELATRAIVTDGFGRAGIHNPPVDGAVVPGEHPYYGEVVLLHTEFSEGETDGTSETPIYVLESQAKRNYSGRGFPMTSLRSGANAPLIGCAADELFPQLFPGVRAPVVMDDPSQPRMSEMMRLTEMKVEETSQGEQVFVTFTSAPEEEESQEEPA